MSPSLYFVRSYPSSSILIYAVLSRIILHSPSAGMILGTLCKCILYLGISRVNPFCLRILL